MITFLDLLIYLNRTLLVLYGIGCLFFDVIHAGFVPSWMQLPWLGYSDFIGGKDGSVYIALVGGHVLRYDVNGGFVACYATGPVMLEGDGSDMQLATDVEGRIYVKIDYLALDWTTNDEIRVYSPDWQEDQERRFKRFLPDVSDDTKRGWAWQLDPSGRIKAWQSAPLRYHSRPVRPGELLFSGQVKSGDRTQFTCLDGSRLERHGGKIVRLSKSGAEQTVYRQSWYLWPFGNWLSQHITNMVVFCIVVVFGMGFDEWLRRQRWKLQGTSRTR